jgi:regulator of protease activity HflC (stomatin/prohibitin superfamily)
VTTLRNVIGSLSLEETLTSRDRINSELRTVLDEATNPWGIRVNRVELKSIDPPGSIQEAMEKQMRAERDKRAAILNAEGEKQSQILTAEGQRQSAILKAEGDKEAKILRAQGDAEATKQVFAAIHEGNPTPDLLAYQYLQTLPNVEGLKLMLVPADALNAMGAVASLGAAFQTGADTAKSDGAATAAAAPEK